MGTMPGLFVLNDLGRVLGNLPMLVFLSWPILIVATGVQWLMNRVIVAFTPDVGGGLGEFVALFMMALRDFVQFTVFNSGGTRVTVGR
jgi:hypothetical protein